MECRLLSTPPISGEFSEVRFQAEGTCTWILFTPEDELPWVGVFGWGNFHQEAVAVLQSTPLAFVIAGGAPYIINYQDRTLRWHDHTAWLTGVTALEERRMFVACDEVRLRAYTAERGELWSTRRVSWDGIANLSAQGHIVSGEALDLDGAFVPFTLDVETGEAEGGSYSGPDAPAA